MTDKERAELHELLDNLIYAHLSAQRCKQDKALHAVEEFVDELVDKADETARFLVRHAPSTGNSP